MRYIMEEHETKEGNYPEDEVVTFKQKKGKFPRRTQGEVALGFVIHLLMLFYWVFVHVYDGTVIKGLSIEARKKVVPDYGENLGRWRYLSYINLVRTYFNTTASACWHYLLQWVCLMYFFIAFFTDVMPRSSVKVMFQKLVDFLFTSLVFPLAVVSMNHFNRISQFPMGHCSFSHCISQNTCI